MVAAVKGEGVSDDGPRYSISIFSETRKAQKRIEEFYANSLESRQGKTFGFYARTLATQYHKAQTDKHFGAVFDRVLGMQNGISLFAVRPAELAPGVIPKANDVWESAKGVVRWGTRRRLEKAGKALFAGTLEGDKDVMAGRVWTDEELSKRFELDESEIALYRQARAAIDASLTELAAAEAFAAARNMLPENLRVKLADDPGQAETLIGEAIDRQIRVLDAGIKNAKKNKNEQKENELSRIRAEYGHVRATVEKIFKTSLGLKQAGYAPLMRFGDFTLTVSRVSGVRDQGSEKVTGGSAAANSSPPSRAGEDGRQGGKEKEEGQETLYFGKFETRDERDEALGRMLKEYEGRKDVRIEAGIDAKKENELFTGISPETVALFGEAIGADKAAQEYYRLALGERSALKRRIHRKGTPGFAEDMPRVLANFLTSNARFAAQRYYLKDIGDAIRAIPKQKGDVKDEAIELRNYVLNPNDPAAPASTVMFAWYLGGSIASAVVNLTQTPMQTLPYLSQFGRLKAVKALGAGFWDIVVKQAMGRREINDPELRTALRRASQEGIVDAQEVFHLYSLGSQNVAKAFARRLQKLPLVGGIARAGSENTRAGINAFLSLWGSMFGLAEKFNRKMAFLAAWKIAKAKGEADPYAFAVKAVYETQGIYNKANRPNLGRSTAGRLVLTFKQYSIAYGEMMYRMHKYGGPQGKLAVGIMLAVLILASGFGGIPFEDDIGDLVDTVGQRLGYATNWEKGKREWAYETLGKDLGDLFLYGISAELPLDFSGRLGLGNLLPGTGLLKKSDEKFQSRNIAEMLGPTAGLVEQVFDAVKAPTLEKKAQALVPKAIRDVLIAREMNKKGHATDKRDRKVVDTDGWDAFIKGIGFNPTKVAQANRQMMPFYQDIALHKIVEDEIADKWARGGFERDTAKIEEARAEQEEWNRTNPDMKIVITQAQLKNRRKQLARSRNESVLRAAPKELKPGIRSQVSGVR